MLNQVRFVLVQTSHPGNIGAAARAMKTMGLTHLYLVAPKQFPHFKASEMASNAQDILEQAKVVSTIKEAIADCSLVIGTSARLRAIPWPLITPKQMVIQLKKEPSRGQIAILFGNEQTGLTNEELHLCHWHLHIPANPVYSSLNIAAAIQVIAYELWVASSEENNVQEKWDYQFANNDEMAKFFEHLEKVLISLDFLKTKAPRQLMTRLKRLFNRARLDIMEVNILRGILKAIETKKSNII